MMKYYQLAVIGFALAFFISATAEENKPERAWQEIPRAWQDHSQLILEGPYVYASMHVPPDSHLRLAQIDDDSDGDPFAPNDPKIAATREKLIDNVAPVIPRGKAPKCLPLGNKYRDFSKIIANLGVLLKGNEWILLATDDIGYSRIHFCTTLQNADIIEQIFTPMGQDGPRSITQLATLVSIENKAFQTAAWTMANLKKLSPVIHARYGIQCRSGEKSSTRFTEKDQLIGDYEIEPTAGEHNDLLDCRIFLSNKLATTQIQVNLATAVTKPIGPPFVLDCGLHGTPHRNYFLILQSKVLQHGRSHRLSPLVSLKKIDGVYAFPKKISPLQKAKTPFTTHSYRANVRFLTDLREKVEYYRNDTADDSVGDKNLKNNNHPKPPARLTSLKDTKYYSSTDTVYNITPHLKYLGVPLFLDEWVYFNRTKNQIIIHGVPKLHTGILHYARMLSPAPNMIKVQAQIVSVDRKGLDLPVWKNDEIAASNPKTLARYSATVQSGEKASCSTNTRIYTRTDSKTGQSEEINDYEFEAEPTLSLNSRWIDMRYSIYSPPLGETKRAINVSTAASLKDGKTSIIELGHPDSATRTHLLILHADVITPDGSFYRDRFKPVE